MSLNFVVLCLIYENSQFKKVTLKIKFPKTSLLFFFYLFTILFQMIEFEIDEHENKSLWGNTYTQTNYINFINKLI